MTHEVTRSRGLLAVRVLRPPLEVEVLLIDERPARLRTLPREGTDRRIRLDDGVRVASGPWMLEERWWSDRPVDRSYWDVEMSAGGIFRLFQDNRTRDWYVDGVYD